MNITKMFIRQCIALIVTCFTFTAINNTSAIAQSPAYQAIKGIENQFPIPTPTQSVNVGTFNAATGKFTGLKTEIIVPENGGFNGGTGGIGTIDGPGGKPINIGGGGGGPRKPIRIEASTSVDAINVELVFNVTNRSGSFRVTANGLSGITSNSNTVRINVGKDKKVTWKVTANGRSYTDILNIKRKPIVGGGAFKIPVLPVAVIYEPVADRNNKNKATYAVTRSIGTKMQMSFANTNSTKKPVTLPQFKAYGTFRTVVGGLSTILGKSKDPQTKALSVVLGKMKNALGNVQSQHTEGTTVTSGGSLAITEVVQNGFTTGTNDGGPGVGDLIVYLKDVEMAWLSENGNISLALLNYDRTVVNSVQFLKQNMNNHPNGISAESVQQLLKLDPFSNSSNASLSSSRFTKMGELEVNGVDYTQSFSKNITQTDTQSESKFSTTVTEFSKGWASHFGVGITQNQTKTTSNVWASSNSTSTSQTTSVGFSLHAEIDEIYALEVYFDKVFGTFATKKVSLNSNPILAGTAIDRFGKVLKNKTVQLKIGNQSFITSTNTRGAYAFRSRNLSKAKSGILQTGGTSKTVQLKPTSTTRPPIKRPSSKLPTKRTSSRVWNMR